MVSKVGRVMGRRAIARRTARTAQEKRAVVLGMFDDNNKAADPVWCL